MTITLARTNRSKALALRNADRLLIAPAQNLNDVVLPQKGSLDAGLLMVLHRGVSVDRLMGKSGWSAAEVMVQVFKVVKRAHLGLERRGGEMYLVYPETRMGSGNDAEKLRQAVQSHRSEHAPRTVFATSPKADATIAL
jgi:hypothetical protein